jgi:putative spermidine/putrescine transport system ATP-binding protein
MPASESFVKFEKVDKSYDGEVLVVKDLNVDIPKGEFLTMLGPSGSGKTTTLMMLAGFETPTNGEIYLDGDAISSIPPYKRGIGMVFQNYALFPHMTVNENLAFPLEVRKLNKSEIKEKVEKALSMVELQDFGNRMPLQLSGGQQQRVALARALVFEPRLVLMDEPLGALDKKLREQMQYEIKHIHGNIGITVVYVTHDQSEALTMSNRIAVLMTEKFNKSQHLMFYMKSQKMLLLVRFIGETNQLKGKIQSINGNDCVVKTNTGETIKALKVNVNSEDEMTTVSLRPERVEINPINSDFENIFEAKIKELIYLGDHIRTRVEVCGDDQFIVKVPNTYKGAEFKEGVSVKLAWKAKDSRALDKR